MKPIFTALPSAWACEAIAAKPNAAATANAFIRIVIFVSFVDWIAWFHRPERLRAGQVTSYP